MALGHGTEAGQDSTTGDTRPRRPSVGLSLSSRLLVLTIVFVMLAEVLIYAPSIARFRKVYLEDQIAKAHLAVLALEAAPAGKLGETLETELLSLAGAYGISLKLPERRILMIEDEMPPTVDVTFDLHRTGMLDWFLDAFAALLRAENRIMRVMAPVPDKPAAMLEVLLDETPMREAMHAFSVRILQLSIIISLIAAVLVYVTLQWMMVRPIRQITESMMRFREDPEADTATPALSERTDEIGVAQRELAVMQSELRAALRQKARLATIGAAVAKINHDLRNTLATAMLASDRLASIEDPDVQRLTPRLFGAMDRAVDLCSQTLTFVRDERPQVRPMRFRLGDLVEELDITMRESVIGSGLEAVDGTDIDLEIDGDRNQLFRVLTNLARNAVQAGARTLSVSATEDETRVLVDVTDDGPGIAPAARERLFQPFTSSSREGGTGLGLTIAREIVVAHGGTLDLFASDDTGTTFRIALPRELPARIGD